MNTSEIFDINKQSSLDKILLKLFEYQAHAAANQQIQSYNTLADLGLDTNATLREVVEALPSGAIFQMGASAAANPNFLIPAGGSGTLRIYRDMTAAKAYIYFSNEIYQLYRAYNTYYSNPLDKDWIAFSGSSMGLNSDDIQNSLMNLPKLWGMSFYLGSDSSKKITDVPQDLNGNGFIVYNNRMNGSSNTYEQVLTENNINGVRSWHRVISSGVASEWRIYAQTYPANHSSYARVGEFCLTSDNKLAVKTPNGLMNVDYSASLKANNGWRKMQDGTIMQWGEVNSEGSSAQIQFPIAFNQVFIVIPVDYSSVDNAVALSVTDTQKTTATIKGTGDFGWAKYVAFGV